MVAITYYQLEKSGLVLAEIRIKISLIFLSNINRKIYKFSSGFQLDIKYSYAICHHDLFFLRTMLSGCPSVSLPVTPFWRCSCHRIIIKCSVFITIDNRDVYAKFQGRMSKVNVTEVKKWPNLVISRLLLQFEFTYSYAMMHRACSSIGEVPFSF